MPGPSAKYPAGSVPHSTASSATGPGSPSRNGATCSAVCDTSKSKLKSLPADETHGKLQPMRRLYACSFSSGARETQTYVTSRAVRWGTAPSTVSAADEQTGQPAAY